MLLGFFGAFLVLGPVVAERSLSGASSWAAILGGQSAGLLAGGVVALRWRPERPLLVATIAVFGNALPLAALALGLPLGRDRGRCGGERHRHGDLWRLLVHGAARARRAGSTLARQRLRCARLDGDLADWPGGRRSDRRTAIGVDATLWIGVGLIVVPTALVLFVREVRELRARTGVLAAGI